MLGYGSTGGGLKYFAYISLPSSGSQFSYQAITLGRRVGGEA